MEKKGHNQANFHEQVEYERLMIFKEHRNSITHIRKFKHDLVSLGEGEGRPPPQPQTLDASAHAAFHL